MIKESILAKFEQLSLVGFPHLQQTKPYNCSLKTANEQVAVK